MTDSASLKMVKNEFEEWSKDILSRSRGVQAAFIRYVYPIYLNDQFRRWKSEGSFGGASKWKEVKKETEQRKVAARKRDPGGYPGGARILVHIGKLFKSVVGLDRTYHRVTATNKSLTIATTVPYAAYVEEVRPFMDPAPETERRMRDRLADWFIEGK